MNDFGFVYLLQSLDQENVYKIGFTKRSPSQRLFELNQSSPLAKGFSLLCYGETDSVKKAEKFFHKKLENFRIPSTELFKGELFIFVAYMFYYEEWYSFCEHDCRPNLGCKLSDLINPYEESSYVF
jgi:hypothetical protein